MPKPTCAAAFLSLFVFMLAGSGADAAVVIEHQPVKCAVADRFPRFEARLSPANTIANARIVFQGENKTEWYSVAMKTEGDSWVGVLPKPKNTLKSFRYYVEANDKSLATSRTDNFEASVVSSASECKGMVMAASVGSASVLLQGASGAAALPSGFASSGVIAGSAAGSSAAGAAGGGAGAGGGLSGAAIAGIAAGGAAVAGVAVAASKGGDSQETLPGTTYTGPFTGQRVVTFANPGSGCATVTTQMNGTFTVTLGASASPSNWGAVTGTYTVISNTGGSTCNGPGNDIGSSQNLGQGQMPMTVSGNNLSCGVHINPEGIDFTGTLTGGVITGSLTFSHTLNNQSGSVTIPVTLR